MSVAPRRRASDTIAETLRREIVGGLEGGALDRTPALMQRFGVSRPTLREAYRMLESEQLIEVRHGSRAGVRVLQPSAGNAARITGQTLQASGATIEQLYEARLAFEPFAAGLLATRRDRRDIAALRTRLAELTGLVEQQRWPDLGAELARFHQLLVELTGNQMLAITAGTIATLLERHQRNLNASRAAPADAAALEFRSRGVRSIARLTKLIEAGDTPAAEQHWREHLVNSAEYWLAGQDRHAVLDIMGDGAGQ